MPTDVTEVYPVSFPANMANGRPTVALVDTACVNAVAGEAALKRLVATTGAIMERKVASRVFRGIDSESQVHSKEQAEIPIGLAGRL